MTINNEYRVARSASTDATFNTLELKRALTFATLEFLDPNDSQHFTSTLAGKGWRNLTPEPHKSRRTFENVAAKPDELEAFRDIAPDWFYLSGHYGRTYYPGDNKTLTVLPAGFFNEPFHKAEWESAWTKVDGRSVYVQGESLDEAGGKVFSDYVSTQPLLHRKGKFESEDTRDAPERVPEWSAVWRQPTADLTVSGAPTLKGRGLLFSHVWSETKLVLLVCCNALVWGKQAFRRAFPNAVIVGWFGKNPSNATPFVRQFLINAFKDVSDPSDPRLLEPDHLARAWMDLHYKQRMYDAFKLGYIKPDGGVFSVREPGPDGREGRVCSVDEIVVGRKPLQSRVFGIDVGGSHDGREP